MINLKPIARFIGVLLILVGVLMFSSLGFSLYFGSDDYKSLLVSAIVCIAIGSAILLFKFKGGDNITKKEGYLIVGVGWMSMVLAGTLPYILSGEIPDLTNAFFETMSGMTTTGASILNDIEAVSPGILFWRSMTQWIGGMGIIVLTVAIFPILGIGGIELFMAEAPGPTSEKIHPRIRETAKRLWGIYVGLTVLLCLIFWLLGMSFFDAVNHALTTMATGGFSTKNASLAAFGPSIQYVTILFMFLAGTNYTVHYLGLTGKFRNILKNDEYKAYWIVVIFFTLFVTIGILKVTDIGMEQSFRDALFQVVSILTTTGFVSADYTSWAPTLTMVCVGIMFLGASAGSTAGGIKLIRHLVFTKSVYTEFRKILHPHAVSPIKINKHVVHSKTKMHILVFLLLYLSTITLGSILVSMYGLDMETSFGAVLTSISNVGPGIGEVGPVDNFSGLPGGVKWILSIIMLIGRLELFTILVLFSHFWKVN